MSNMHDSGWKGNVYTINIHKTFNGRVGVRDDTIRKILRLKGTLRILVRGELRRTIQHSDIEANIISRSGIQESKIGQPYRFCYFEEEDNDNINFCS